MASRVPPKPVRQKHVRFRSERHLAFIRTLPCCITGTTERIEAAHVSYADFRYGKPGRGIGLKESDNWTVPLAHDVHMKQHDAGNERAFWAREGIDPVRLGAALFINSGDYETCISVLAHASDP